jgi:PAS domain S-box-containing protein
MSPHSIQATRPNQIILDSIAEGVFTVDLDFRVTSFNRAAEKITGLDRRQAMGKLCREVFRTSVCDKGCLLAQVMATGQAIVNRPVEILGRDDRRIPVNVNAAMLKNSNGELIGGVETFRDLTTEHRLRQALQRQPAFDDIVSKNEKMQRIFDILPRIAESGSTVLIQGASGTGKELVARAIHHHSPQRKGPFVAVNCGALPDTLCESELFGYKAGAFTDARKDKPGRFARAENGTIFLDEIGDISPVVQSRLLRVLEDRVYEPLGSTRCVSTNARIITATHRDLGARVEDGRFRQDLFFRINVIRIHLPPLSARREDIPLLVDRFIEHFNQIRPGKVGGISSDALAALMAYHWPGNVRELKNAIEQAVVLCPTGRIELHHLPDQILPEPNLGLPAVGLTLREIEKRAIELALQRNGNRRVATARELGIDKNTLRRKIKRLGITVPA